MATKTRRKANTAMVFNPNRGLSIGGGRTVRKTAGARKNPARKAAVTKANPKRRRAVRRRNNPASVSGLVVTAVMAGIGVSLFDAVATRVIPQTSSLVRVGVKAGGAYLFQQWGGKVPLLGKYKNDIALVLGVSAAVDLMKLYVLPPLTEFVAQISPSTAGLLSAPAPDDLGNIYGNAPNGVPFYS